METAPQIDFQGMEPSDAFRERILSHIARLEERFGRLTSCRVAVKAPGGRHKTGGLFDIRIYLSLPDERAVSVERTPHMDERFQHFEFALNDAFARAERQLQDEVSRMRGKIKHHAGPTVGLVTQVMREDGFGFIESADGREIYFHHNSVAEPGFDSLNPGDRVNFAEEEGEKGPQASRVTPLAERAPG